MVDDEPPSDELDTFDSDVEGWLSDLAEAEGLTREETLQFLISSYWRLAEIARLVDADSDERDQLASEPRETGPQEQPDTETLRDHINHFVTDDESGSPVGMLDELSEKVERLEERLNELEATEEEPIDEVDINELLADLEALENRSGEFEDRFEHIETTINELDGQIARVYDTTVDTETFTDYVHKSTEIHDDLLANQNALRDRVKTEFSYLRDIIEHLLNSNDTHREDQSSHPDPRVINQLQSHLSEQQTLDKLSQTANRRNITTAQCGYCDESVDLNLLKSPTCPHCDNHFTDIDSTSSLFGFRHSHKLVGENMPSEPDGTNSFL